MWRKLLIICLVSLITVGGILLAHKVLQGQTLCGLYDGGSYAWSPENGCGIADVNSTYKLDSYVKHLYDPNYNPSPTPSPCVEEIGGVWELMVCTPEQCDTNNIYIYTPMFLDFEERTDNDNVDRFFTSHCWGRACGKTYFICEHNKGDNKLGPYSWDTGGWDNHNHLRPTSTACN
jgi:hypothetical protein